MRHTATWLLKFFSIALKCDFPILEVLLHSRPIMQPFEIWELLSFSTDDKSKLRQALRTILNNANWRIEDGYNHFRAFSHSGMNFIRCDEADNLLIFCEGFGNYFIDLKCYPKCYPNDYYAEFLHCYEWELNGFSKRLRKSLSNDMSIAMKMMKLSIQFDCFCNTKPRDSLYSNVYNSDDFDIDFQNFIECTKQNN